jgi:uncharacterized spore protein YtfJ
MLGEEVRHMKIKDIIDQARDTFTVRRVYGEPIERNGLLLVPVAAVWGGAGGGGGEGRPAGEGSAPGSGFGGGWGGETRPIGAFVIRGEEVSWQPVVDVNRAVLGGQIVAMVALVVAGMIVRARMRSRS